VNLKLRRLILFVFILSSRANAQYVEIDSLKRVLDITKTTTVKANQYNKLADLYKEINPDSTLFYAHKAGVISSKANYTSGLATSHIN
jgi:hypothetical protein